MAPITLTGAVHRPSFVAHLGAEKLVLPKNRSCIEEEGFRLLSLAADYFLRGGSCLLWWAADYFLRRSDYCRLFLIRLSLLAVVCSDY